MLTTDGESIDYTYDGDLLTGIAQSGTLNADINYTYNTDYQPVGIVYAGGTQTLTYDDDGLLIQSGGIVIERKGGSGHKYKSAILAVITRVRCRTKPFPKSIWQPAFPPTHNEVGGSMPNAA